MILVGSAGPPGVGVTTAIVRGGRMVGVGVLVGTGIGGVGVSVAVGIGVRTGQ